MVAGGPSQAGFNKKVQEGTEAAQVFHQGRPDVPVEALGCGAAEPREARLPALTDLLRPLQGFLACDWKGFAGCS